MFVYDIHATCYMLLTRAGTKEPSECPVTGSAGPNTVGAESWVESVDRNAASWETKPWNQPRYERAEEYNRLLYEGLNATLGGAGGVPRYLGAP